MATSTKKSYTKVTKRSKFPDALDTLPELFDLPANEYNDASRLSQLKAKAVLTDQEQNELKTLTTTLQDYMITPEFMNSLSDSIVEVQHFFNTEVDGYIGDKQREWDTYVNNFTLRGNWSATEKYKKQNLVLYEGNLYMVVRDVVASTNNTPKSDTNNYKLIAWKGDKGDIGLNAFYKGAWVGGKDYAVGDAVSVRYGESWNPLEAVFICKQANRDKKPDLSANSDYWLAYHTFLNGTSDPASTLPKDVHYFKELD